MTPINTKINCNTIISISDDLIHNSIDNETIILSLDNSEYYSLDPIGTTIWNSILKPKSVGSVIDLLIENYDVPYTQCKIETIQYIRELNELGIIQISNG